MLQRAHGARVFNEGLPAGCAHTYTGPRAPSAVCCFGVVCVTQAYTFIILNQTASPPFTMTVKHNRLLLRVSVHVCLLVCCTQQAGNILAGTATAHTLHTLACGLFTRRLTLAAHSTSWRLLAASVLIATACDLTPFTPSKSNAAKAITPCRKGARLAQPSVVTRLLCDDR